MFVAEAGFYLLPMRVRTSAPVGQTPVLRVPLTRDHLSAIGGITPEGRIFMQTQEQAYRAEHVVAQDQRQDLGDLGWIPEPSREGEKSSFSLPVPPNGSIWSGFPAMLPRWIQRCAAGT